MENRDSFDVICRADISDTFSAKMEYMQKYPSHFRCISWLVLIKFFFGHSWPNWRHQSLSLGEKDCCLIQILLYIAAKTEMFPCQWQEGGNRVYNIVLWLWRSHESSSFNSFLHENLPAALTNVHISGDQGCPLYQCGTKKARAAIFLTLFKNIVTQIPVL